MLLALIGSSLIAYSSAATIQSTALCSSDYSWAANSLGQSPCEVVANVNAVCNAGNGWIVPALINGTYAYDSPVGAYASACTCSWASYNLISACTDCQGYSNDTTSWSTYSFGCAGKLDSDTYFPANLTLEGTRIPYWATTNPTTWADGTFNAATAQNISSKGYADVGAPSTSATKSRPIGAIVGGVIGGIVVLLGATLIGIYLIRRTSRSSKNANPSPLLMSNQTHSRSQSDVTVTGYNMPTPNMSNPLGYTSLSSSPMRPTSPTIRTHASSIRSFPFFSSGGSTVNSPSMRQQSLPPPVPPAPVQWDETAVEPFTLPPTNNHNPDRKQANGAYPVYDPPTAPPAVRMEVQSSTPTPGGRTRYNPPAYTEQTNASPEAAGGSSSRQRSPPVHGEKGSVDTQLSLTSGSAGTAPRVGGSNPAMGNRFAPPTGPVMNPLLSHYDASASTSAIANTGHGRQLDGNTSTDDSFSVGDIA